MTDTTRWLFGPDDPPWIDHVLDVVESSRGEPWRMLLERIEHSAVRASPGRVARILGALRRVMGGRADRAKVAKRVRALVLGHPALDPAARADRLATAAGALGLEPSEIEPLLWADLATERPVVLPNGRPDARRLAALANLERIQGAVRQAYAVRVQVWDNANELVRAALRLGLITTVTRDESGAITLAVTGPLALFHATTVYGRALAALVPLLVHHDRFVLEVETELGGGERTLRFAPPIWLPPTVSAPRTISVAERLARDLEATGHVVERDPPPIEIADDTGNALLFADLVVSGWRIEILGFASADYIQHKRAQYRSAGIETVVLCVDRERSEPLPDERALVPYRRRIDVARVLAIVRS